MVENDGFLEAENTCWYLIAVLISVKNTAPAPRTHTSKWEVNKDVEIPNIPLFGGIESGNIVKVCLCLGFWEKVGLNSKLKGILGNQGFGMREKGRTYAGWKLTKECEPCGFKIGGNWKPECPCNDKKSIDLNKPHVPTNQTIDSDSKKYVASDGTSIIFSDPGNFESVMKEIVEKEKSIPLKCKAKNPSLK